MPASQHRPMPLASGTKLGPYEIIAAIGAGGMGEVYSARDRRLDRSVAVKTLSASIADSPDARQRFEREAKAISRLSHPHICALYDVGHEGDVEYLVMELLEGETLARRLTKGPLPIAQVLRYGREIADALAAAHRQGIVHRDLKPGNVMLTSSGVKLLDFGLAKTTNIGPVDGAEASTAALPASLTADGTLLGTAPYMAPEQIQGQPADARSDIFALGAVLYEMATGRRAFGGATAMAIAGSILHEDPPSFSESKVSVPPAFGRLVRTCLAKDPATRWQTAQDVAIQLTGIDEDARLSTGAVAASVPRGRASWLPWALAAAAVAVAAVVWVRQDRAGVAPAAPVELQLVPPADNTYYFHVEWTTLALSPDGTRLAFVARNQAGEARIWIRSLATIDAKPIAGTERALSMFWSPDGQSIAFFADRVLKRLDFSSGIAVPLCPINSAFGQQGTWSPNGQILFASTPGEAIHAVSSAGGAVSDVVTPDASKNERGVKFPWFLPDGRRFLYTLRLRDGTGRLMLGEPGKPPRVLLPVDSNAQFVEPGYVVFAKDGTLVAQRFDPAAGEITGRPLPIADSVSFFLSTGIASFATSSSTLVYQPQRNRDRIAWVDRSGKDLGAVGVPGDYFELRLASAGRLALLTRALPATGTWDIWSLDLERGPETRLTLDDRGTEIAPVLLRSGRTLIFSGTTAGGPPQLFRKNLDTGEDEAVLPPAPQFRHAYDVTPDDRVLAYGESTDSGGRLLIVPLDAQRPPTPLQASSLNAGGVRFSPDGRYYTFTALESGRPEVYVAALAGGGKQPVSAGGAQIARWSPDGREILYLSSDARVVSVPVRLTPTLELGKPETLVTLKGKPWIDFDVAPDKRLLAIIREVVAEEQPLTARLHWSPEIRK
jgi:Tol biopolymer transport system component